MKNYLKKNISTLVVMLACLVISILFFLFSRNADFIIKLGSYIIGIIIIIIGITMTAISLKTNVYIVNSSNKFYENPKFQIIFQGLIVVGFGLLILLMPDYILRVIIGSIFILVPLIKIIISDNGKEELKKNLFMIILGIILVLTYETIFSFVLLGIGVLFLVLLIYLVVMLVKNYNNIGNPNVLSYIVSKIYKI